MTEKREAVMAAALDLFASRTFDRTSMPGLAERASVGPGTIYRYFASKEELGNAVYLRWKSEMLRYLTEDAPRGMPVRREFSFLWRRLWQFASDHPEAIAFLETHPHADYLDDQSVEISARVGDVARSFILRGQRLGDIRRADADVLIAMVFGAFIGMFKAGLGQEPARVTEAEECLWEMLKGPEERGIVE
ncbi:MAG TPA: TetR/AcrR family transcriptional regulator [Dehalococcoidia bacterium]|nr:TetR/AcrR family transcriptional regulator [Dehalococcoidia bacterium]